MCPRHSERKLFGLIGSPVKHSLSPQFFNAAFKAMGMNANYQLFEVKGADLKDFLRRVRTHEISGLNVTIPHKEAVIAHLNELSPTAKKIGAVNTLVLKNNRLYGENTDGPGYITSLMEDAHLDLARKKIILIGAGGAARAIAFCLCSEDIKELVIVNRNKTKARALKNDLATHFHDTEVLVSPFHNIPKQELQNADLLINATSLGLLEAWPNLNFLSALKPTATVSDIVYTPKETSLLQTASKQGLKVHYGTGMFIRQALLTFEIFTGEKINLQIFAETLKKFF